MRAEAAWVRAALEVGELQANTLQFDELALLIKPCLWRRSRSTQKEAPFGPVAALATDMSSIQQREHC